MEMQIRVLFRSIPVQFRSIPFYSVLFPFNSVLFGSIPFYSVLFGSIVFYSVLFGSIVLYCVLFGPCVESRRASANSLCRIPMHRSASRQFQPPPCTRSVAGALHKSETSQE